MAFMAIEGFSPTVFVQKGLQFVCGKGKLRRYAVAATVVIFGTIKVVSYIKKQNRRKKWNSVGKDVVVLHMFQRGCFSPNLSPFVLKLETYLRMADIPYQVDFDEPMGPKGKSPWITLNGEDIGDSQLIMDKLGSMYGKDFSAKLTLEQKAVGLAMRIMVEEHFLWCLAVWRYLTDDCRTAMKSMKFPLIMIVFKHAFQRQIKNLVHVQGIGRHSNQEIEEMGRKDLIALSTWLGDKQFFMGDEPTEVDCAMFGMLAQIQWNSAGSPYLRMFESEFPNLSSYCLRVKDKFWLDWNQCLYPPKM